MPATMSLDLSGALYTPIAKCPGVDNLRTLWFINSYDGLEKTTTPPPQLGGRQSRGLVSSDDAVWLS